MSLTAAPLASMPPAPDLMAAMRPRSTEGDAGKAEEKIQAKATQAPSAPTPSRADQAPRPSGSSPEPNIGAETQDQRRLIAALEQRDREVRDHENAHRAAGGDLVRGGSYDYRQGPDGRRYAIGGDVKIDTAPSPADPEATAEKMAQVIRAALAPARPSTTDLAVAAQATAELNRARTESQNESIDSSAPPDSSAPAGGTAGDREARAAASAYRGTAAGSAEAGVSLRVEA
ncbi:putative metalloprotease CJM1_0395 family protein [Guyparkeria sp. 1SP6A2]|nr:putative metalloprotease CJM1_0395 family protein [Guyparkeria sp. 1SP6A2]